MSGYTTIGLAEQLKDRPFDSGTWNEILLRSRSSKLSPNDTKKMLEAFAESARGGRTLPAAAATVATDAFTAGTIDKDLLARFGQVVYGDRASIKLRPVLRRGYPANFTFDYGKQNLTKAWDFVYALRQVLIDGGTVDIAGDSGPARLDRMSGRGSQNTGFLKVNAPPGKHHVVFLFDAALLPVGQLPSTDLPGQMANWPNPMAHWTISTPATIEVSDKPYSDIEGVTDPTFDPRAYRWNGRISLAVPSITVLQNGYNTVLRTEVMLGFHPLDQSYDVLITVDGKSYECGQVSMQAAHAAPATLLKEAADFPPGATSCTVTLTPNFDMPLNTGRMWAKTIDFKDVPLKRETP